MEIDYNQPLELNALGIEDVPVTPTGIARRVLRYKAYIRWEDIIAIEQFVKYWVVTPEFVGVELTNILTIRGTYLVEAGIKEVSNSWAVYKAYKAKEGLFKFN